MNAPDMVPVYTELSKARLKISTLNANIRKLQSQLSSENREKLRHIYANTELQAELNRERMSNDYNSRRQQAIEKRQKEIMRRMEEARDYASSLSECLYSCNGISPAEDKQQCIDDCRRVYTYRWDH